MAKCSVMKMKTRCGTPSYNAPEIVANESIEYSPKVDIWSLGCVLFITFSGYPPFSEEYTDMSMEDQVMKGRLLFHSQWRRITIETQNMIKWMLTVEPAKRPSAVELMSTDWMKCADCRSARQDIDQNQRNQKVPVQAVAAQKDTNNNDGEVPVATKKKKRLTNFQPEKTLQTFNFCRNEWFPLSKGIAQHKKSKNPLQNSSKRSMTWLSQSSYSVSFSLFLCVSLIFALSLSSPAVLFVFVLFVRNLASFNVHLRTLFVAAARRRICGGGRA
ncbi:Protein CBG24469 [Caenorhabditis briggsae]|uniref:Protein CBG24469 n=1 Tax=Caenorhabditis briggsae TaxID=6238 RepID=H8WH98_CAEBR|nr:Protein CBG24469 [Caenorhabditis briggsae]CCG58554.1 Protein CBG24469 [Caenorhabditis briggsae]